jgi:hypothetical protein
MIEIIIAKTKKNAFYVYFELAMGILTLSFHAYYRLTYPALHVLYTKHVILSTRWLPGITDALIYWLPGFAYQYAAFAFATIIRIRWN